MGNKKSASKNELEAAKEINVERQLWLSRMDIKVKAADKIRHDKPGFVSRYKSPLSLRDRAVLKLREKIAGMGWLTDSLVSQDAGFISQSWEAIIRYLYEAGILVKPQVQFEQLFNDEPKLHMLRLWASLPKGLTDGGTKLLNGGFSRGVSCDLDEAFSKVVGELLERYPLAIYSNKLLIRASIADLQKRKQHFTNPFLVAAYSEEQKLKFPNRNFDHQTMFRWAEGRSLMTSKQALIPAQMIFWNYSYAEGEPFVQQPITNGAGGMFTRTEAILAGLYELIQRDAFFVYWFNKIAPPRIALESVRNKEFQKFINNVKRYELQIEVLDITSDIGIPAFLAVLLDYTGRGPAIALGGGCEPHAENAIIRAVTEAVGVRHWIRATGLPFTILDKEYKPFSAALGQAGRLLLWGHPERHRDFKFFLQGPLVSLKERHPARNHISNEADPEDELQELTEIFRQRGEEYEIFYYEAKHPVLETLGYHSVKVVVPGLLPLYMNESCAPLGAKRIYEACRAMGYNPAKEINSLPHPFP